MAGVTYRFLTSPIISGSALIVGNFARGDANLCFVCHGQLGEGAQSDIQTPYSKESTHTLLDYSPRIGPPEMQCRDCHDVHGTARDASDAPYPSLLRSYTTAGVAVYRREEMCVTCHADGSSVRWAGLAVFRATAHGSVLSTPASGTDIRCANCHDAHGSSFAPLIREAVIPPAVVTTLPVTGNDRSLCLTCHLTSQETFGGKSPYQDSAHGVTTATVLVDATWASAGTTRTAGECQVCHAPMGKPDGAGGVTAKMLEIEGRALCDACHDSDGPAGDDLASIATTAGAATDLEVLASRVPSSATGYQERLAVYSRDTTGTPRLMMGPREYFPSVGMGEVGIGDIDNDARNELVIADPSQAKLNVMVADPLRGLTSGSGPGELTIASAADLVAVADILSGYAGAEIAVVNNATGQLRLYRFNGASLTLASGPHSVGANPTSIASGDTTGTAFADLVVTTDESGQDGFYILTESGGALTRSDLIPTRSVPRGASVGDAWASGSKDEIVICNSGESVDTVSVFDGSGALKGHVDDAGPAGSVAYASSVGDYLPGITPSGTSGLEVAVVLRNTGGMSGVNVFPQLGAGGLDTPKAYDTGSYYNSGSVAGGDVDGDGRVELVWGNGGNWTRDANRQYPSVQIARASADGTALATVETLWSGGVELAGEPPALAVGDLGLVGMARHPVGAVADTHVSTEVATLTRHVECVDCHNVHEATSTPSATSAVAPAVYGRLKGSWGVSVTNNSTSSITLTEKRGVSYEYELCLKCHSAWSQLGGSRSIAVEVNALNPSVHAVEQTATGVAANSGSYVSGWDNDSVLYCVDCHGNASDSEPVGLHRSREGKLLARPYLGALPSDTDLLCYSCHKDSVYLTGTLDGVAGSSSLFYDQDISGREKLHAYHTNTRGYGCAACHVSHGSTVNEHLVRSDVGYTHTGTGGTCDNACHSEGGTSHTFARP